MFKCCSFFLHNQNRNLVHKDGDQLPNEHIVSMIAFVLRCNMPIHNLQTTAVPLQKFKHVRKAKRTERRAGGDVAARHSEMFLLSSGQRNRHQPGLIRLSLQYPLLSFDDPSHHLPPYFSPSPCCTRTHCTSPLSALPLSHSFISSSHIASLFSQAFLPLYSTSFFAPFSLKCVTVSALLGPIV